MGGYADDINGKNQRKGENMNNIIHFPVPHSEPGLAGILAEIVREFQAAPGADPLAAKRHAERIYVAGSYAHSYLQHVGFSPEIAEYANLASMNPYVVAEHIASDLDPDGQAGIARTVSYLILHVRKFIDEPAAA
jgi:hypothetical protein